MRPELVEINGKMKLSINGKIYPIPKTEAGYVKLIKIIKESSI